MLNIAGMTRNGTPAGPFDPLALAEFLTDITRCI
jgi:hypothetical protein